MSTERRTLEFGGRTREFLVTAPDVSASMSSRALVLNLHGFTSNMTQQAAYSRLPALAAARGWVTVTPQGLGRMPHWTVPPVPVIAFHGTDDKLVLFGGADVAQLGATTHSIDATELMLDFFAAFLAIGGLRFRDSIT